MPQVADWTFLVFMAADNDLSEFAETDLSQIRLVGSTDRVHVVVEIDNAGTGRTRRIHVERDGVNERVESIGETNSGDPAVLEAFVSWARSAFPARRYALVLWNHGGGWAPAEVDGIAKGVDARGWSEREPSLRSASPLGRLFFRRSLERALALPSAVERAICSDDGSGHSLDTIELRKALARCVSTLGQRIDLLGLDACLMSNVEIAYQVRREACVMVASEISEPADGWPYDRVLSRLVAAPQMTARELACAIVTDYVDSYKLDGRPQGVTQTALDLNGVAGAAAAFDKLADCLIRHMPAATEEIWAAQRRSMRFFHDTLWDVRHFCEELANRTSDAGVRSAATEACDSLRVGNGSWVLAAAHHGTGMSKCGGASIYFVPPRVKPISIFYPELEYARDRQWLALLRKYHDQVGPS